MKIETAYDKVCRTSKDAEKAARRAEAAVYTADAAHIAWVGAMAVDDAAYQDKCDLATQAEKAAAEADKAADDYAKDVEDKRLASAKATLVADAAQQI